MKNIIGLLLIMLFAACIVKCSCFAPSRLSLPVTIRSERQHELRASKKRRKKSEDDTDINNTSSGEQDVVEADQKSSAGNLDQDSSGAPKQTTLSGGTSLIFDMARRMLVWDDELYQGLNDASPSSDVYSPKVSTTTKAAAAKNAAAVAALPRWRPKSITQQSISNANPSFRTSSPIMTNAGYASILKRNSRKKNKPSMWRHCLRVYDKMGELENARIRTNSVELKNSTGNTPVEKMPRGVGSNLSPSASNTAQRSTVQKGKKIKIKRGTAHHEAVLVAASKLGLWEEALHIFQRVEKASIAPNSITAAFNASEEDIIYMKRKQSRITDNMVLSVIKACVRGSRAKQTTSIYFDSGGNEANLLSDNATEANTTKYDGEDEYGTPTQISSTTLPSLRLLTIEERRKPLDLARDVILNMEEQHDIPLVSRHVNPVASAYLDLGLRSEAVHLINNLNDRNPPSPVTQPKKSKTDKSELTSDNPRFSEGVQLVSWRDDDLDDIDTEDEENEINNGYASPQLNVFEVQSKDRGSYSLLVKGAVMDEDWAGAVAELQRMNDAGLHPNASNLNSWSEVMERGCRPAGKREVMDDNYYSARQRRRSWRKRRDGIWLGNLH